MAATASASRAVTSEQPVEGEFLLCREQARSLSAMLQSQVRLGRSGLSCHLRLREPDLEPRDAGPAHPSAASSSARRAVPPEVNGGCQRPRFRAGGLVSANGLGWRAALRPKLRRSLRTLTRARVSSQSFVTEAHTDQLRRAAFELLMSKPTFLPERNHVRARVFKEVLNICARTERRGHGGRVYRDVEHRVRAMGVDVVVCYPVDKDAEAYWRRMGFERCQESLLPAEELLPINQGGKLIPEAEGNTKMALDRWEKRVAVRTTPKVLKRMALRAFPALSAPLPKRPCSPSEGGLTELRPPAVSMAQAA